MAEPSRRPRLTLTKQIFIGLGIGVVLGWLVNRYDPSFVANIRPFSQLFLRMIKMIIAPLLFATLVAGIAGAGHFRQVGRMGLRAIQHRHALRPDRGGRCHRPTPSGTAA